MARVIITLPDEFLKEIGKEAKKEHRSRSEFMRESLRTYLAKREILFGSNRRKSPKVQKALKIMEEARQISKKSKVKGSEIIRRWRYRLAKS